MRKKGKSNAEKKGNPCCSLPLMIKLQLKQKKTQIFIIMMEAEFLSFLIMTEKSSDPNSVIKKNALKSKSNHAKLDIQVCE